MLLFSIRRYLFFALLVVGCLFLITPPSGSAAPVFKEAGKKTVRKTTAPAKSRKTIRVFGKHGDISAIKRLSGTYLLAKQKYRVTKNLSARTAIIIDNRTGRSLFSKRPDTPRQPASTIKVLTGMIAIKSLKNSDHVSVSRKAARQPRSKIYLNQKKKYLVNDLINAVLLSSANDASVALAEKIAGNEHSFARMMTLRAQLWGAKSTICKTATGLTAKGQKSTARDLAIIFRHAMNDREFAMRIKRTKARTTDGKTLRNHNKALWQVRGTEGGKTGYTNAARQTYVGKFKRGSNEIIIAIMGSERMWTDLKHLVNYGFAQKLYGKQKGRNDTLRLVAGMAL